MRCELCGEDYYICNCFCWEDDRSADDDPDWEDPDDWDDDEDDDLADF